MFRILEELLNDAKCSHCGFKVSKLDQELCSEQNHRMPEVVMEGPLGSGLPNVIKEVKYVKSISKIDRMNLRFAGKKRAWLVKQIDPKKKLKGLLKNANNGAYGDRFEVNSSSDFSSNNEDRTK